MREDTKIVVGMDVSDQSTELRFANPSGEILDKKVTLPTNPESFEVYFGSRQPSRVVLEVGAHSQWMGRLLRRLGHEVWTIHPRQVRAIASGLIDKVDDIDENVHGAIQCGIDAVRYSSVPQLVTDLRDRGVEFNY